MRGCAKTHISHLHHISIFKSLISVAVQWECDFAAHTGNLNDRSSSIRSHVLYCFPLYSIYHATKFAVEGFTESLQYELAQFNIKMKLIEPGPIVTDFYGRSRQFIKPTNTNEYDEFIQKFNDAADKSKNQKMD